VSERRTWILAGVLLVLAAWVVLVEGVRDEPPPPAWERDEKIVACGDAGIAAIEITRGDRTVGAKRSGEQWLADVDAERRDRVSLAFADLARSLCGLPILDRIAEPGALTDYGLESPTSSVRLELSSGNLELDLGAATPAQNRLYARFREQPDVLQVGVLVRHEVDKVLAAMGG
jgi:hypothetical protein